jgi:hypothetical protein
MVVVDKDLSEEEERGRKCKHKSYDLGSYEMIEGLGWSWMVDDTLEKACCLCHDMKKLTSRNPMYYCRSCHGNGICNGCWSELLLKGESGSGRGGGRRQCRNRGKVIADNQTKSKDEEDDVTIIIEDSEEDEVSGRQ